MKYLCPLAFAAVILVSTNAGDGQERPENSAAKPTGAGPVSPIFAADIDGSYIMQVVVNKGLTSSPVPSAAANTGAGALAITTTSLPDGIVNKPYSSFLAAIGGTPPYAWSIIGGRLPGFYLLDSVTGRIYSDSGAICICNGNYQMTFQVSDSLGQIARKILAFNILDGLLHFESAAPALGEVGIPYSFRFQAIGGALPYTWSLLGLLPNGLSLDPVTGTISGTPTAASSTRFKVTVQDSSTPTRQTDYAFLSLRVSASPVITTKSLPGGKVGAAYSATVTATGGTLPYTWSASGLPNGLTLHPSTGVISGIPTWAGTAMATVIVTDSSFPAAEVAIVNLAITIVGDWSRGADAPTARMGSTTGIGVVRGKITLIGGHDGSPGTGTVNETYDPVADAWRSGASYPRGEGRQGLNQYDGVGERMILIGGSNIWNNYHTQTVDVYYPLLDTWQLNVATYPVPVGALSTAAFNDSLYCFGGMDYNSLPYSSAYRFDPTTNAFTRLADLPRPRAGAKAFVRDRKVWVAGGLAYPMTVFPTSDIYDPGTNVWSTGPNLPRGDQAPYWVGTLENGRVYAVYAPAPSLLPTVYAYTDATNTWELLSTAPLAQNAFGAIGIGNTIYTIGGGDPKVSTVQRYRAY